MKRLLLTLCLLAAPLVAQPSRFSLATQVQPGFATTALGDTYYALNSTTFGRVAGNTTTTRKFWCQVGTGSVSAAPGWCGPSDFPTLNQDTTGSAAKWTTARLLAGNSVDGSANATFANKFILQGTTDTGMTAAQFLGALGTGVLKNTTTTGVLSIAALADIPSALTTKGDLPCWTTLLTRKAVGTTDYVLTADPTDTCGFDWKVGGGGGGSGTVDGISTVTLVAGTGMTISDNTPGAGQITLASSGGGGGYAGLNDFVSEVPVMTSDTAPSGTSSASSYYSGTPPWYAFEAVWSGWVTNGTGLGTPQWIQYQFTSGKIIKSYAIVPWSADSWPDRNLTAWHLDGSNDGSSWTTLDTRTKGSKYQWTLWAPSVFSCANSTSYTYYRLVITANGGNAYVGVQHFELYVASSSGGGGSSGIASINADTTSAQVIAAGTGISVATATGTTTITATGGGGGSSLAWLGAWDGSATYAVGDIVSFSGHLYYRLVAGAGPAAPSNIQSRASVNITSLAFSSDVTSGHLLVVSVGAEASVSSAACTDTLGTTYTRQIAQAGSTNDAILSGTAVGTGANTVSCTGYSASWPTMGIAEFAGAGLAYDTSASAYTGSSPSTVNITVGGSAALVVCAIDGYHSANTYTAYTGMTMLTYANGNDAQGIGYRLVSPSTVYAVGFTVVSGADNQALVAVSFSAGSSPAVDTTNWQLMI